MRHMSLQIRTELVELLSSVRVGRHAAWFPRKGLFACVDREIAANGHDLATIEDFQAEKEAAKKSQLLKKQIFAPVAQ